MLFVLENSSLGFNIRASSALNIPCIYLLLCIPRKSLPNWLKMIKWQPFEGVSLTFSVFLPEVFGCFQLRVRQQSNLPKKKKKNKDFIEKKKNTGRRHDDIGECQ